jgi:hypothetical protein
MPVPRKQKKSQKQEAAVAARLGGRPVAGSGAGWVTKNDVKTDDLSVEVKYTDAKSYSLKYADLQKAEKQALLDSGREFAFLVGFGKPGAPGSLVIEREYVVVSREYFEHLRNQQVPERECYRCKQPFTKTSCSKKTYCTSCIRAIQKISRDQRATKFNELKESQPCSDCGNYYPAIVMDFDHRDPDTKQHEVAAIKYGSWEKLLAEIAKCDLVCANCHRIRTLERGYYRRGNPE